MSGRVIVGSRNYSRPHRNLQDWHRFVIFHQSIETHSRYDGHTEEDGHTRQQRFDFMTHTRIVVAKNEVDKQYGRKAYRYR